MFSGEADEEVFSSGDPDPGVPGGSHRKTDNDRRAQQHPR